MGVAPGERYGRLFQELMEQVLIWECQGEIPRHKFYPVDETILRRLWHGR